MGNFKEKLLGLMDNGVAQAIKLVDTIQETMDGIDWDEQFESLNDVKDSLLKKGNELIGEFNELIKQVKNNISDFEVTVPFDEALGEKFEAKIDGNKLTIEVTFKDETSERSNKTTVVIPQNCDVEKMTQKYNTLAKTMTVVIPKILAEPTPKAEEPKAGGFKLKKATATKKKVTTAKTEVPEVHEAASKLLKKFRENTEKASGIRRAPNGRFVRREPKGE